MLEVKVFGLKVLTIQRRREITHLNVRVVGDEEPRGTVAKERKVQIHTGKQVRFKVEATDVDGNTTDAVGDISFFVDDTSMVDCRVEGSEVVVGDNPSTGTGSTQLHVSIGGLSAVETIEIIPGDAVAIGLIAGDEEDRAQPA